MSKTDVVRMFIVATALMMAGGIGLLLHSGFSLRHAQAISVGVMLILAGILPTPKWDKKLTTQRSEG